MKKLVLVALIGLCLSGCSFKSKNDNKYASLKYSVDVYTGAQRLHFRCEDVAPGLAFNCTDTSDDHTVGLVLFSGQVATIAKAGDEK